MIGNFFKDFLKNLVETFKLLAIVAAAIAYLGVLLGGVFYIITLFDSKQYIWVSISQFAWVILYTCFTMTVVERCKRLELWL